MYKIKDGNTACADIAYKFSELSFIYPITPSSPMASELDELKNQGEKNFYNKITDVIEMQSEAGAAGALHGALLSGSIATTFTASQGLLLMIPNMYKIAGEMLPCVIHVASRSLATHALSIQGDHQDIYATRQTGFCILASSNVQEAQDLSAVAHLSTLKTSLPFVHFFDGFRTSHEVNKIKEIDFDELKKLLPKNEIEKFKSNALKPNNIITRGTAQNEDIYFQCTEARNAYYKNVASTVENYMNEINKLQETNYKPFNYYGSKNAENVIVALGSVTNTIKLVVEDLKNVGLVEVHLYRPFSKEYLQSILPNTVKNIAVLDRTNEAGSIGEPLYLDVLSALKDKNINIVGGRYGLSGKNTTPQDIYNVFKMLETNIKENFTIGINDDLNKTSLEQYEYKYDLKCDEVKIYGFGSDGSVGASKDLLKILGDDKFVQGYFEYDSKKSGGLTISHLRFSDKKIEAPYYLENPKIIVVTKDNYLYKYDILKHIKNNGILIVNTNKEDKILNKLIPTKIKEILKEKNITLYKVDANKISENNNIPGKIGIIIESIILNKLNIIDYENKLINLIEKRFRIKGNDIVISNINAIKNIILEKIYINDENNEELNKNLNIIDKLNCGKGNELSTKEVLTLSTGILKGGNTKYEKRALFNKNVKWISENCIQCGKCSLICPHSVIRPIIDGPDELEHIKCFGSEKNWTISISKEDCTGCGLCTKICPGKLGEKALVLEDKEKTTELERNVFDNHINENQFPLNTIKGSQLNKSLFEFSGACAGCGETPYLKLLTQLFGHKLIIANATGCSSIYGASCPSTPYNIPWANSLFEDNAEFGYGMYMTYKQKRNEIEEIMKQDENNILYKKWLENKNNYAITHDIKTNLVNTDFDKNLIDYIESRSVWCIGGDGWAYDIGFSGIDHILSSNENINILVLDTEVYSNTGGQSSKATKKGAIAKFATLGKRTNKKDLFKIATTYENVYAATICLGANENHAIKTFIEAEEHEGPSIIIAYAPCIEHGIKGGLSNSLEEERLSVECGYNILMRYNNGKITIDSKEPDYNKYEEFLNNEIRFNSLKLKDKSLAEELLQEQKNNAIERYNYYKKFI
ncbi:MAG: pyruvate:ferredoxin (flavodoxin) oxidoreductase [Bacilli bacterium]|nr:pyruvate:ferredoxin (flavodoxin) oxidoreductase [Bacilli bacterium]